MTGETALSEVVRYAELRAPLVLQVEDAADVSQVQDKRKTDSNERSACAWRVLRPVPQRLAQTAKRAALKLLLTDGRSFVPALEMGRVPGFSASMQAGIKIAIRGAAVRRGTILLCPATCLVLGAFSVALVIESLC
jgi:hypothetical protein